MTEVATVTKCSYGAPGCFYDIKTTESNPLDTAPGYMPILEYRWYGSAGTCKPSDCTVIAFKKTWENFLVRSPNKA